MPGTPPSAMPIPKAAMTDPEAPDPAQMFFTHPASAESLRKSTEFIVSYV
jgi:hypothetical protein